MRDALAENVSLSPLLKQRRAGILLHPTSLPGPFESGDIGHDAYRFVEFLAASGMSVWQMLPLGPTHEDGSPYQCLSVQAANPMLVSLHWLQDRGWLDLSHHDATHHGRAFRQRCLLVAFETFNTKAGEDWKQKFTEFREQEKNWLRDYALFMAIKNQQQGSAWMHWPEKLAQRDTEALLQAETQLAPAIAQVEFEQFIFFTQWRELRDYARKLGVFMFGDMPIFVAHDSADVWAHRKNFLLDAQGQPVFVAGVPPDAFSETGQRWGNPLYDWNYMQQNGFNWWLQRFHTQRLLCDLIRVDHFRGFEASWYIPAQEQTAIHGEWVKVPGDKMLSALFNACSDLSLVAEDLGLITKEVEDLRHAFALPGMKILQFAFGGDATNPYLPHNHQILSVVYTGTHDNDTTLGWYRKLPDAVRHHVCDYFDVETTDDIAIVWRMIGACFSSVARLAVIPMQDAMQLDTEHRMNIPGTVDHNWRWRYQWTQVEPGLAHTLRDMLKLYGRLIDMK
jgi:4-alpha-glucanotransferase